MKGSIQLKNGYWYMVFNTKDKEGNFKYKWESTGLKERGNKKAAKKMLDERLEYHKQQKAEKDEKLEKRLALKVDVLGNRDMIFTDYIQLYIDSIKDELSPYVYFQYCHYLNVIKTFFRDLTLIEITKKEIGDFNEYAKEVRKVNNTTIRHYSEIIRPALRKAFIDKLIPDNPYDEIKLPPREKPLISFYNKAEIEKLFEVLKGHRLEVVYKVLAYYGFRRSEALGLKWEAIDFGHSTISVNHKVLYYNKAFETTNELKTEASRRTLPLISDVKEALLAHKKQIEKNKFIYGNAYNYEWQDYLFVDEVGNMLKPDTISKSFSSLLKQNELKKIRLHDLRHSCASLLLANGVSLKQIQEWLGHEDFLTTANIYAHLDFSGKIMSANILQNALSGETQTGQISIDKKTFLKNVIDEMDSFGFSELEEYLEFLDNIVESQKIGLKMLNQAKQKENGYSM